MKKIDMFNSIRISFLIIRVFSCLIELFISYYLILFIPFIKQISFTKFKYEEIREKKLQNKINSRMGFY